MDTRYPIVDAIADLHAHVLSYPEAFPGLWKGVKERPRRCGVALYVCYGADDGAPSCFLSAAPINGVSRRTVPPQHGSAHGKLAWTRLSRSLPLASRDALELARHTGADGFSFALTWPEGEPQKATLRAQWVRTPSKRSRWHTHADARAMGLPAALTDLHERCSTIVHHPAGDRLWWAGEKAFTSLVTAPDAPSARRLSHALWCNQPWDRVVVNEAHFPTVYPNPFAAEASSDAAQALVDAYKEISACLRKATRRWEPAVYGSLVLQHRVARTEQAIARAHVTTDTSPTLEVSLSYNGRPLDVAPSNCLIGLDEDALEEALGLGKMAMLMLFDIPAIGLAPIDVEQWVHAHPGGDDVFMGLNFSRHDQGAFSNGLGDFHAKDFARVWGRRLAGLAALAQPTHFWQVHTDSRGALPIVAAANGDDALRAATLFWHPEPEPSRHNPDAVPSLSHKWEVARLVTVSERDAEHHHQPVEEAA